MSRSYWGKIREVGRELIEQPEYKKKQQATADKDREAREHRDNVEIVLALNRVTSQQERNQNQRAAAEKKTNRREWIAVGGLYFAALVGIAAIVWSGIDASKQRKVMNDQIGIMQSQLGVMRAEQRAHISVTPAFEFDEITPQDGKPIKGWRFFAQIENNGTMSTKELGYGAIVAHCTHVTVEHPAGIKSQFDTRVPAMRLEPHTQFGGIMTAGDCGTEPTYYTDDPEDLVRDKKIAVFHLPVAPHQTIPLPGIVLPQDFVIALRKNHQVLFLDGIIKYRDISPDSPWHLTKYCYAVTTSALQDGSIKPRMSFCAHWNCTDSECSDDKKANSTEAVAYFRGRGEEVPQRFLVPN